MKHLVGAFDDLLHEDMDRKQFLQHVGAGVLAVVGVSGLIKALTDPHEQRSKVSSGFGMGSYGGASQEKALVTDG